MKPDGAFVAVMLGGETLQVHCAYVTCVAYAGSSVRWQELRSALAIADMERLGGVTSHVSPFAMMRSGCTLAALVAGYNRATQGLR